MRSRTALLGVLGGLLFATFPLAWLTYPPAARPDLGNPYVAGGPLLPFAGLVLARFGLALTRAVDASRRGDRIALSTPPLGFAMLAFGSTLEFYLWPLLTIEPPGFPWLVARLLAFPGLGLALVGTTAAGLTLLRSQTLPRQPALGLTLAVPLGIPLLAGLALGGLEGWAFALGVTVPVGGAWALAARSLQATEG